MPKKQPRNAYYFYMTHFREEQRKQGIMYGNLAEVAEAASSSWKTAPPSVRAKFESIAKAEKESNKYTAQKYTSQGVPITEVERRLQEERDAEEQERRDIKNLIKSSITESILNMEFFVIDVNYYCHTQKFYVICEFTLMRFNLQDGIIDEYHELVNPGSIPTGYTSDAKLACEDLGMELPNPDMPVTDYVMVMATILEYLGSSEGRMLPPMFTMPKKVAPVQDFILQLCYKAGDDDSQFRVFKLNTMFYELINFIKRNDTEGFPKESLALVQLNKDPFQYSTGLGCSHHEETEKFIECTKSRCTRWIYTILDHCCPIADIELKPGTHLPRELDISTIAAFKEEKWQQKRGTSVETTMGPSRADSSMDSFDGRPPSVLTGTSYASSVASSSATRRPVPEVRKPLPTYRRPPELNVAPSLTEDNFPKLGGRGRGNNRNSLNASLNSMKLGN